jgi:hypothetical protein
MIVTNDPFHGGLEIPVAWSRESGLTQVPLVEKVSRVASGVVVQLSKDAIAESLVKGEGLKVEGVAMGMEATAGMRLVLRCPHQAASDALAPESLRHPKLLDEEPAPVRVADQAANKLRAETGDDHQIVIGLWRCTVVIEEDQSPHNPITILGGAMFFDAGEDFVHRRRGSRFSPL